MAGKAPAAASCFDWLPQELIDKISEMLEHPERCALASTSRTMYRRLMTTRWRVVRIDGREGTMLANIEQFSISAARANQPGHRFPPFTNFIRHATIRPSEQVLIQDSAWDHEIVPPPTWPLEDLTVRILRAVTLMSHVRYLDIWMPKISDAYTSGFSNFLRHEAQSHSWDSVRLLRIRVADPALEQHVVARMANNLMGFHSDKNIDHIHVTGGNYARHFRLQRLAVQMDDWTLKTKLQRLAVQMDDWTLKTKLSSVEPNWMPNLRKLFPDLRWLVLGESTVSSDLEPELYNPEEWVARVDAIVAGLKALPTLERFALVIHPRHVSESVYTGELQEGQRRPEDALVDLIHDVGNRVPNLQRVAIMEDHPWYFEGIRQKDGTMAVEELVCHGVHAGEWPSGINE